MFGPRHRNGLFTAVAVGATLSCCSAALGQVQVVLAERYRNDTGVTARCLMKYLYNYQVTAAVCVELPACTASPVGRYTIITCHGPVGVPAGGSAQITLQGTKRRGARILTAEWYSDESCSTYSGEARAVASFEAGLAAETASVTVEHGAHYWDHDNNQPGAAREDAVYGRLVKYAVVPTWYAPGELVEGLFDDESIDWHSLTDFTLSSGQSKSYSLDGATLGDLVLFGFYTVDSPTPGQSDFELVQFHVPGIPALSAWGVLVMAMLLLTAATLAILRRRARTTSPG